MTGTPLKLHDRVELRAAAFSPQAIAIVVSVLTQVVLVGAGVALADLFIAFGGKSFAPAAPLLVVAVALVMAHCSLAAIWWTRANWSPHKKSLAAVICFAALWLLLIGLLDTASRSGVTALAWAACIVTQILLTGLIATSLELKLHYALAAARSRFNLSFLMIWTSVIAVILGVAGALASRSGFRLSDVPNGEFFPQLQAVAIANSILAGGIYASIRLTQNWAIRALACTIVVITTATVTQAAFFAIFGVATGATVADLVWLTVPQGAFLVATLVPLERARETRQ